MKMRFGFIREALTERPNFAEALLNLGHALKAQGNVDEARNSTRRQAPGAETGARYWLFRAIKPTKRPFLPL